MNNVHIHAVVVFGAILLFSGACQKKQPQGKPQKFDPQLDSPAMLPLTVVDSQRVIDTSILREKIVFTGMKTDNFAVDTGRENDLELPSRREDTIPADDLPENNQNKSEEILESKDPNILL